VVRLVLAAINPRLRQDAERVLNSGGTVSFGKISLSPAGVVWKSKEPIPYAALVRCKIDGSILRVKAEGKWLDNIAVTAKKVPNIFILLDLIEEKRSTAPGKTTVAMAVPRPINIYNHPMSRHCAGDVKPSPGFHHG